MNTAPPAHWVIYQPTDRRQALDAALRDSIQDHTTNHRAPTAVLLHPTQVAGLLLTAADAGLAVHTGAPGRVQVDVGCWGLA